MFRSVTELFLWPPRVLLSCVSLRTIQKCLEKLKVMQIDNIYKMILIRMVWQVFNFRKCKCPDTGHGNEDAQYTVGGTVLNATVKEKDSGLTINADMKVSEQCGLQQRRETKFLD